MISKKQLEELETVNFNFIKSLQEVISPFIKKLEMIHKNKVELNEEDLSKLKNSIDVIKIYASKEASVTKFLSGRESEIIYDINCSLAIISGISKDAQGENFDSLYEDCEELRSKLLKLENDIAKAKKTAA